MQIGEIVRLNSGSPDLRVVSLGPSTVTVEWNNEAGEVQQHVFPRACVVAQ